MKFNIGKSGLLKKVFLIFLIGLVCRVGLNVIYDIDAFKDFNGFMVFISYSVAIVGSVVVYELPGVNFNVFNVKVIKQAITEWCKDGFNKDKIMIGEGVDGNSLKQSNDKEGLKQYTLQHRNSSGEYKGKTSAAVKGLYGKNTSGKVSAGISGLYGESSRPSTARSDRTEYIVDKERFEDNVRNRNIKKMSVNSSKEFGRVSGFKPAVSVESRELRNVYPSLGVYEHRDNISKVLSTNQSLNIERDGPIQFVADVRGGFKPVKVYTENGRTFRKEMGEAVFPEYSTPSERSYSSNERSYSSSGGFYSSSEALYPNRVENVGWNSIRGSGTTVAPSSVSSSPDVRRMQSLRKTYRDISNDMNVNYVKPSIQEPSKHKNSF